MRWISRVGDDAFGRLVLDTVGGAGVDVSQVEIDPQRPTGCYGKELDEAGTRVRYYREGSAASVLGPEVLGGVGLGKVSLLHLSGITAALSERSRDLMDRLLTNRRGDTLVSFDVNWRPALWTTPWTGDGPEVTARLARRADLVFVGRDEAEALWGVVVTPDGHTWAPSLAVDVVEPVGAGDAFAAGFLAGTLARLPDLTRLRLGHADDAEWSSTRIVAGGRR